MIVNRKGFAGIVGCQEKTVAAWVAEGMPVESGGGKQGKALSIDTVKAIAWMVNRQGGDAATAVARARVEHLQAHTAQRRLETRQKVAQLVTPEEVSTMVTGIWLAFLDAWRGCTSSLYYALQAAGAESAAVPGRGLENECVAWIGQARDIAAGRASEALAKIVDERRIDELMRELDAAVADKAPAAADA